MHISPFKVLSGILLFTTALCAQQEPSEPPLLLQLDRDFDKAATERGVDGWVAYFAPNGSMLSNTTQPTTGLAAIRADMESVFSDKNFSLRWHPVKAEMLIPGVLGYTVGRWERIRKTKEGTVIKKTGIYTSIWKKQPDRNWKIVLDTGSPDELPVQTK
jgi:ketosteroid isomerase-like protein